MQNVGRGPNTSTSHTWTWLQTRKRQFVDFTSALLRFVRFLVNQSSTYTGLLVASERLPWRAGEPISRRTAPKEFRRRKRASDKIVANAPIPSYLIVIQCYNALYNNLVVKTVILSYFLFPSSKLVPNLVCQPHSMVQM